MPTDFFYLCQNHSVFNKFFEIMNLCRIISNSLCYSNSIRENASLNYNIIDLNHRHPIIEIDRIASLRLGWVTDASYGCHFFLGLDCGQYNNLGIVSNVATL